MTYQVIGKCSICGGDVEAFTGAWFGTEPPIPHCRSCGAVKGSPAGVVPMVPNKTVGRSSEEAQSAWIGYQEQVRK